MTESKTQPITSRFFVVAGISFALSLAFTDLIVALPRYGLYLRSSVSLFQALSLSAIVSAAFCFVVLIPFFVSQRFVSMRKLAPANVFVLTSLASFYVLTQIADLFHGAERNPEFVNLKVGYVVTLAVLLGIAFGLGWMAYFLCRDFIQGNPPHAIFVAAYFALPFVLAETLVFVWAHTLADLGGPTSAASLFLDLSYVALVAVTLFCAHTRMYRRCQLMCLAISFVAICGMPLVLLDRETELVRDEEATARIQQSPKYVILVTVDTLRADSLSCYGSKEVSTPNIDAFARDGVLFGHAVSPAPWTIPAMGSIMTGMSPLVHGATEAGQKLSDSFQTLAEYLQPHGYHTWSVSSNINLARQFGFSQGFDEYDWFSLVNPMITPLNRIGKNLLGLNIEVEHEGTPTFLTRRAVRKANHAKKNPFFLWLHYLDPHTPYEPPEKNLPTGFDGATVFRNPGNVWRGKVGTEQKERTQIQNLYEAEVSYVDSELGVFFQSLKDMGIYDDALIVFTSDHGEEFWEHGGFDHGHALYRELIRVPFIIKPPRSAGPGTVSRAVSTESVTPTILDACEIPFESEMMTGQSLFSLLQEPDSELVIDPIISTGMLFFEEKIAVTYRNHKLIKNRVSGEIEFYDLLNDPWERSPLPESESSDIQEYLDYIRMGEANAAEIRTELGLEVVETVELDGDSIEQLEALGYIHVD